MTPRVTSNIPIARSFSSVNNQKSQKGTARVAILHRRVTSEIPTAKAFASVSDKTSEKGTTRMASFKGASHLKIKPPSTVHEVRRFLGIFQYYRDVWPRRIHT